MKIADVFRLLSSVKSSEILSGVSLETDQSCPKAALLFPGCSSLLSASAPFPDHPPLESSLCELQGSSWSVESVPYKQGHGKASMLPWSPTASCSTTTRVQAKAPPLFSESSLSLGREVFFPQK